MPELSNLLRQGLSHAQNGVSAHPDADTITAYIEQSLPAAERQTVVGHLAVCEPCREVVALSQPQAEPAMQPVLQPAPVPAWRKFLSPAFGLFSAVAAMAVIAVAVLQLPHNSGQKPASEQAKATAPADQPRTESNQPQPPQTAASNAGLPTEHPAFAATSPAAENSPQMTTLRNDALAAKDSKARQDVTVNSPVTIAENRTAISLPAPPPQAKPILTAGMLKKDYVNTGFFANGSDANVVLDSTRSNAPSAAQPQGAPARAFTASNDKITIFSDIPANAVSKTNTQIMTPPPSSRFGCTVCGKMAQLTAHTLHLRSVTPTIRANSLGTSTLGGLGMFSNTLQQGQPNEVPAAAKTESSGLASSESLSFSALGGQNYAASPDSLPTVWRVAGGKLVKSSGQTWEDAYPAAALEFACVTSRGKDIWAGGKNTVLIHSRDSGSTWETIKLGDNASGTVVSVLAGASNVQVKTSDNQLWLSSDGGKSWTLSTD